MEAAPLRNDLAEGPEGGRAVWAHASDGVRIRVGGWQAGTQGTVLLFTGRTEYIEKYGRMARSFGEAGLATVAVDWRGQGMADRVASDPNIGHVRHAEDYQLDAAAFIETARKLGFSEPFHLLGHSMGGAIGLRALDLGLPVVSATFSAPMWAIGFPAWLDAISHPLVAIYHAFGMGLAYAPGTGPVPYPLRQSFEGNELTSDPESYEWLRAHIRAEPLFGIGGPSMTWMREAFRNIDYCQSVADVPVPTLTLVGSDEGIVAPAPVRRLAETWHNGRFEIVEGARHEAMMERPPVRADFTAKVVAHMRAA